MATQLWWMIHKDLVVEQRTWQAWPAMLLSGIVVAVVFSLQMETLPAQQPAVAGGLLWLAALFAGLVAIERAGAVEQQNGCWDGLVLYPVAPSTIYLAKLAVNVIAQLALLCLLIPLFVVLDGLPLLRHPGAMVLVALLGGVGMAVVGTLVGTLAHGLHQRGAVLSLLVMPLVVPVVLAASEATRLIAQDDLGGQWWRWVQFLGAFDIVFATVGVVLVPFLTEE